MAMFITNNLRMKPAGCRSSVQKNPCQPFCQPFCRSPHLHPFFWAPELVDVQMDEQHWLPPGSRSEIRTTWARFSWCVSCGCSGIQVGKSWDTMGFHMGFKQQQFGFDHLKISQVGIVPELESFCIVRWDE